MSKPEKQDGATGSVGFYDEFADQFHEATININMEAIYRPFLELLPQRGRILDAGCGTGRDAANFTRSGYAVTAFDASAAMVKAAAKHTGLKVLHLTFEQLTFDREFDGVWACASLLHVPKTAIDRSLGALVAALKPGGILYTSFKYGDREEISGSRLFNCYTETTLADPMTRSGGLQEIQIWKTADQRPDRSGEFWLNALHRKTGP